MIHVINSTELRKVGGVAMMAIGAFPAGVEADDPEALANWELNRDVETEALTWGR